MTAYVPIHDRSIPLVVDLAPLTPRYASPDLDPTERYAWTQDAMSKNTEYESGHDHGHKPGSEQETHSSNYSEAGPSKKRRIDDDSFQNQPNDLIPIAPSIFGIAPRNEFTKTVGEFLMAHCRGQQNIEIEIKLGTLHAPADPQGPLRRLRMPTMSETIMPHDYPVGPFTSNMIKAQHTSLNRLLNSAVEGSIHSPVPIHFYRAQHSDSFHADRSGKIRVSRDRQGNIVENGVIRKRRIADLNIYSPREAFDWRVSISVEDPCDLPYGPAQSIRGKDRACYKHQMCQVDLTVVTTTKQGDDKPVISYELEIEVLDVPALIEEGEKEEQGELNRFDEMLQSCLDTTRMLIRNVG